MYLLRQCRAGIWALFNKPLPRAFLNFEPNLNLSNKIMLEIFFISLPPYKESEIFFEFEIFLLIVF